MLNMKIDQIAFISHSAVDTINIKHSLGLEAATWIEDVVHAKGTVRGVEGENRALLLFNYDNGIETEILQYLEGPNYASEIHSGHVCHIGMHYSGEGPVPTFDAPIIQRVETQEHTNPYLLEQGRHYRYTIYDTRRTHGVCFKVIERLQ